jgi:hypothetical protein
VQRSHSAGNCSDFSAAPSSQRRCKRRGARRREVAARYDVRVAEVFRDLASDDWVGGSDCLHPDDSGYVKVTIAFLEALGLS